MKIPEDKKKTAFSIGKGLWQFTVMSFGFCNASLARLMEKVLQQLLNKFCLIFDDVIIFSKDFEGLLECLRKIFLRMKSSNLKLNPKKMLFFEEGDKMLMSYCFRKMGNHRQRKDCFCQRLASSSY